jgi:hypothetical protein
MTREEAAQIVRQKWEKNDGCRSCGWKSALYEFEPIEQYIDDSDIAAGFVDLPCQSDADDGGDHRGARVYLRDPL